MAIALLFAVDTDAISHQEIAAAEMVLIFVDDAADVQPALHKLLFVFRQAGERLLQLSQRRLACQFENHLPLGLGNHHRLANRPATLRNHRTNPNGAMHKDRHGSAGESLVVEKHLVLTWAVGPAGHAPQHRDSRLVFAQSLQQSVGRKAEGLA